MKIFILLFHLAMPRLYFKPILVCVCVCVCVCAENVIGYIGRTVVMFTGRDQQSGKEVTWKLNEDCNKNFGGLLNYTQDAAQNGRSRLAWFKSQELFYILH
jgi:hypothetical protein